MENKIRGFFWANYLVERAAPGRVFLCGGLRGEDAGVGSVGEHDGWHGAGVRRRLVALGLAGRNGGGYGRRFQLRNEAGYLWAFSRAVMWRGRGKR